MELTRFPIVAGFVLRQFAVIAFGDMSGEYGIGNSSKRIS